MLDVERALARAEYVAGVIPLASAEAVSEHCDIDRYDIDATLIEARAVGNPAEPLIRALRERIGDAASRWVHYGATSQDIIDTAAMLVARNAVALIDDELTGAAAACARLAADHQETPMAGRTLLQQAVPTTFGAKAAGWLIGIHRPLTRLRTYSFLAQLGGAAGTLAPLGGRGAEVISVFADELGLVAPVVPWHGQRGPWAELGAVLDQAAQACAKVGLDVILMAQSEVGEVAEREGGRSSTMPDKRNPIHAALARACARIVHVNVGVLSNGEHEHERAAGAWQAEWTPLSEALAHAGGAAAAICECLSGLEVFPERMKANMRAELYGERNRLGIDDPAYLGSAPDFVDLALRQWREAPG